MEKNMKIMLGIASGVLAGCAVAALVKRHNEKKNAVIAGLAVGGLTSATTVALVLLLEDRKRGKTRISATMPHVLSKNDMWYHIGQNTEESDAFRYGKRIIVGISTSNSWWGKIIGEHVFIMCMDENIPQESIMLDAGGRYGSGRTSDILSGEQMPINVESYLKYWDNEEKLTTFELKLSVTDESKIRNSINELNGYSYLKCAEKASEILNEHFSHEIEKCRTPVGLLNSLNKFAKKHPDKITIRHFDFKTNEEIPDDSK